jgi:hypothetical protein
MLLQNHKGDPIDEALLKQAELFELEANDSKEKKLSKNDTGIRNGILADDAYTA